MRRPGEDARHKAGTMQLEGVACEIRVADGNPGAAIVAAATELGADLVVVGHRRRKLSATVEHVVGHLACAVLLVNAPDRGPLAEDL